MQTVYVIPGYGENTRHKRYRKSVNLFKKRGFRVTEVKVKWKNGVMTDYVKNFVKGYKPKPGCILFGFSFGAIIALLAADTLRPRSIVLCSLSPYFKQDITATKAAYGKKLYKYFTPRQVKHLENLDFVKTSKVKCKVILIAGDRETVIKGKNYPLVLNRSKDAKRKIKNSELIVVKGGKHDISQKQYHNAIRKVVYKL